MSIKNTNISNLEDYKDNIKTVASNKSETMALLNKLLKEKSMTQADLAKELKRDKTTVNRWCKDSREVAWDNALKISEVLKCHPVEIYQPIIKRKLIKYIGADYKVYSFDKTEQYDYSISYEFANLDLILCQVDIPGNYTDGRICVFENIKGKKFSKDAIGKFCYMKPSKKLLKIKPEATDIVALLHTNHDGTFKAVRPDNYKPVSENCVSFDGSHIGMASPLITEYDPSLKSAILQPK